MKDKIKNWKKFTNKDLQEVRENDKNKIFSNLKIKMKI